jgi:hypothetical protein
LKFLKDDDLKKSEVIKNALFRGFAITNNEVLQAEFDSNLSGSTVVTVLVVER